MILGIGCDIVELKRVARLVEDSQKVTTLFTLEECLFCDRQGEGRLASYAARFAAKEAVAKALGCGLGREGWLEIEVIRESLKAPRVRLNGAMALKLEEKQNSQMHISLSHGRDYAIAYAIWEGGEDGRSR